MNFNTVDSADRSGSNPQLFSGEVHNLPVVNTSSWEVALGGIKVDGESIDFGTIQENAPSARVYFGGELWMKESLLNLTMARVPGSNYSLERVPSFNITMPMYFVPCNTSNTLAFTFGGKDYSIPPKAWVAPLHYGQPDEVCYSLLRPAKDENVSDNFVMTLGYPFLSNVYTVLKFGDAPQVGFATLSDAARGVVPERIENGVKPTGSMPGYIVLPQPTTSSTGSATIAASVSMGVLCAALGALVTVL